MPYTGVSPYTYSKTQRRMLRSLVFDQQYGMDLGPSCQLLIIDEEEKITLILDRSLYVILNSISRPRPILHNGGDTINIWKLRVLVLVVKLRGNFGISVTHEFLVKRPTHVDLRLGVRYTRKTGPMGPFY